MTPDRSPSDLIEIRRYYDEVYYKDAGSAPAIAAHLRRLARRLRLQAGDRLLDVGCGTGEWLRAAASEGALPAGIDLSRKAIEICRRRLPHAELHSGPAEDLPFESGHFDMVTCLGCLEHFVDPERALTEMMRVARPGARFLFLVPNLDFLTRRLGLYRGTEQAEVREEARPLAGWEELFDACGFAVTDRWRDLHLLSRSWIFRGAWVCWPFRAAQALALPFWPLSWQYQVYYLCTGTKRDG